MLIPRRHQRVLIIGKNTWNGKERHCKHSGCGNKRAEWWTFEDQGLRSCGIPLRRLWLGVLSATGWTRCCLNFVRYVCDFHPQHAIGRAYDHLQYVALSLFYYPIWLDLGHRGTPVQLSTPCSQVVKEHWYVGKFPGVFAQLYNYHTPTMTHLTVPSSQCMVIGHGSLDGWKNDTLIYQQQSSRHTSTTRRTI